MKSNYLFDLNQKRNVDRFNMIYESIMSDTDLFKEVKSVELKDKNLELILEQIEPPQFVVCESTGEAIFLEDAIFMNEQFLITEGILDSVQQKIEDLTNKIKQGIQKVLQQSSEKIKAFCQKVKQNKVVAAIVKKLKLEEKLKAQNFKQYVKVTKPKTAEQSVSNGSKFIISQTEKQITDSDELKKYIKYYQEALEGKRVIKSKKTGEPRSKEFLQKKLDTYKAKLQSIKGGQKKQDEKGQEKPVGSVKFDVDGIKERVNTIAKESTNQEVLTAATTSTASVIGATTQNGQKKKEQKKGLLKKTAEKLSTSSNKIGNALKKKFQEGGAKVKKWFNAQNKVVKVLIVVVIAILAILTIYFLITSIIWPVLYNILHGGIVNAAAGIFRIYASGKTFKATYKAGKKAWQSGQGWGKAFLMIGLSIFAALNLSQMAAQGKAMMASAAQTAASSTADGGEKTTNNNSSGSDKKSIFELNDSKVTSNKEIINVFEKAKKGEIPGMEDMSKYQTENGWYEFKNDLRHNPEFQKWSKDWNASQQNAFFSRLGMYCKSQAGDGSYSGNSWFQKAMGIDGSKAEAAGKSLRDVMVGNNTATTSTPSVQTFTTPQGKVTLDQLHEAESLLKNHPEKFMPEDMQETFKLSKMTNNDIIEKYPDKAEEMFDKVHKAQQAVEKWKMNNEWRAHSHGSDLRLSDAAKKALAMIKKK